MRTWLLWLLASLLVALTKQRLSRTVGRWPASNGLLALGFRVQGLGLVVFRIRV